MEYKRLTKTSEITDSATLKALCESCGESGCDEFCEEYQDNSCKGCPIQEAFQRLSAYEDSGLSPEKVKEISCSSQRLYTAEEVKAYAMYWAKPSLSGDAVTNGEPENNRLLAFVHYFDEENDRDSIERFLQREDWKRFAEKSKGV